MARPLTRAQTLQNTAFLRELSRTGNIRQAAREVGVAYATMQHRRGRHPAFAQRWDAALAVAQARLLKDGVRGPEYDARRVGLSSPNPSRGEGSKGVHPSRGEGSRGLRTLGGEAVVVRGRGGRLQVRRAHPGKLTRACEQAFLLALSATANVTLAAAAVGVSFNAFNRRRKQNPAFAREMQAALEQGYEAVEGALMESWMPDSHEDDAWRHNDPPAVPSMTASQALQLMYLHQKAALLDERRPDLKLRPGEGHDAYSARLAEQYAATLARKAEYTLQRGMTANEPRRGVRHDEPPLPPLPDLNQVTGWSRADPEKTPHHPKRALFGGWRMGDMSAEDQARAKRGRERRRG